MLPRVPDEQHTVIFLQALDERVYLLRARHARLIDHIEPLPAVVRLLAPCQMAL
jgi:hypothetical protein